MQQLINLFGDAVIGAASGFDRIVFQGMIKPLMYSEGAMSFFGTRRILFKEARDWVEAQTLRLVSAVEEWSIQECGERITYLPSSATRKEEVARKRQKENGITSGLVGTWSCVESGSSYRLVPAEGAPKLRWVKVRCKHLYLYLDHPEYGWMSIRIQTWLPYRIQIAMNGREWLFRQLKHAGISFERQGNKLLHVDDFDAMQGLLDQQLRTNWCSLLDSFASVAFPTMRSALGDYLRYTWILWQSEWASDLMFRNRGDLSLIVDGIIRHAFMGGHPERLLRYFARPVRKDGQVPHNSRPSLRTRVLDLGEGCRVRHWCKSNSVKIYYEANVLRFETTINDPSAFKVNRRKQGANDNAPKERLPLRKGVADTTLRARVSQEINDRVANHVATMSSPDPLEGILSSFTSRKRYRGRSVRALDPTGKDLAFLRAIADPRFKVRGFCNKDLRGILADHADFAGKTKKQLSGKITRIIRLLRDHRMLRRVPKSRRYLLTAPGLQMVTALQAALAASIEQLTAIAA